ncbi:MAG: hypothetical protein AAFV53_11390 [Myxococcota bacterium]
MKLEINTIRLDGGTQSRVAIDQSVVDDYADAVRDGKAFAPVVVYYDGTHYWLADGFHRVGAHSQAGRKFIEAEVHQGTHRDAILHSVGANANHGLRRTNEDKRRAVLTVLRDPEWGLESNRQIAEWCGVTHPTVGKIRKEFNLGRAGEGGVITRMGKDGKVYTIKPRQKKSPWPEGCDKGDDCLAHVRRQSTLDSLEGLFETPGIQVKVSQAIRDHAGRLKEIQQSSATGLLDEARRLLGHQWPDKVEAPGLETAFLKRLDELADGGCLSDLEIEDWLEYAEELEDLDEATRVLLSPDANIPVRRTALISFFALKRLDAIADTSLTWHQQEVSEMPPGARRAYAARLRRVREDTRKRDEETQWVSESLNLEPSAALDRIVATKASALADPTDKLTKRLEKWFRKEQSGKRLAKRAKVRNALKDALSALVALERCPRRTCDDYWMVQGAPCPNCYAKSADVLRRQREQDARDREARIKAAATITPDDAEHELTRTILKADDECMAAVAIFNEESEAALMEAHIYEGRTRARPTVRAAIEQQLQHLLDGRDLELPESLGELLDALKRQAVMPVWPRWLDEAPVMLRRLVAAWLEDGAPGADMQAEEETGGRAPGQIDLMDALSTGREASG